MPVRHRIAPPARGSHAVPMDWLTMLAIGFGVFSALYAAGWYVRRWVIALSRHRRIRFLECAKNRLQRLFLNARLGGRHCHRPMRRFRHESCCHPTFPLRSNTWTTPIFRSSVRQLPPRSIGALSNGHRVTCLPRYPYPPRSKTRSVPSMSCRKEKQTSSERLSARG
jgi:hypothetical protein